MRDEADSELRQDIPTAETLIGRPVGHSILIIEDEVDIAVLIRRILEKTLPCTVNLAHDGDAGLAELQRAPYDLAITDMRLPKRNRLHKHSHVARDSVSAVISISCQIAIGA